MIRTMLLTFLVGFIVFPSTLEAQHQYIGVKQCAPCHRTEKQGMQTDIWQKSKHASAFTVLDSTDAKEIAKKKGLSKSPSESPECLKCHAPEFSVDAKLIGKTFSVKDGVQCESCHGPGSDYKVLTVMKDRTKAVAAGMLLSSNDPKLCQKCHTQESPTFKGFNYKEMWEKIKHPVPKAQK